MNERLRAALNWCKKREKERQKLKALKTKSKMATLHRMATRISEQEKRGEMQENGNFSHLQEIEA